MATTGEDRRITRIEVSTSSVILLLAALAAVVIASQVLVDARRILSWALACAVVAALVELVVDWISPFIRRTVAVLLVLVAVAGLAGTLAFGVFQDLDREVRKLQIEAPLAAQRIENNDQFGSLAAEVDLDRRVTEAMRQISAPSSGITGDAIGSIGAYVVCAVLTVLFISWGPRLAAGLLTQLDPQPAERVRAIFHRSFTSARRYVVFSLIQSALVGTIGALVCYALNVPAPAALGLALAAFALVPHLGIVIGSLPILLLVAGLEPALTVAAVAIGILGLQVTSTLVVQPLIVRRSHLYVGPAMLIIGALIGFELYGIGGAMYAGAVTVLAVAVIDAVADTASDNKEQLQLKSAQPIDSEPT